MKQHLAYEEKLHKIILENEQVNCKESYLETGINNVFQKYLKLHKKYMNERNDIENDMMYIL